jgi:hypothetical protein
MTFATTRGARLQRANNNNKHDKHNSPNDTMKTKLTHKEMMNAFRDATNGKRVDMTINEVVALVDSIEAESHNEAVSEILIELGWKERE